MHADLSSVWYPEIFIIGSIWGYSIYTFHFLHILYLLLAAAGMYHLIYYLYHNKETAIILGLTYALCGFFQSNAQHIRWIYGGVWAPFVILYYLKFLNGYQIKPMLLFCFFLFLMITGAYPPLTFILFYLILTLSVYYAIKHIRAKNNTLLKTYLSRHLIIGVIAVGFSLGIMITIFQSYDFINRFQHLDIQSITSPFSPRSLLSMIFPFSVSSNPEFFNSDISMINSYIGLIPLIFIFTGLRRMKSTEQILLFVFGIIALFASFGTHFPLFKLLYEYVPLMNKFRFPSVFRLYFIIGMIIASGNGISRFLKDRSNLPILRKTSLIIASAILIIILVLFNKTSFANLLQLRDISGYTNHIKNTTVTDRVVAHAIIQLIILALSARLLFRKKIRFHNFFALVALDLFISVQLNVYQTTVYPDYSASELYSNMKSLPKGFPLPDYHTLSQNKDKDCTFEPVWINATILQKRISFDNFNSFNLNTHYNLDQHPSLRDSCLKNRVLYLSSQIFPEDQLAASEYQASSTKDIYLDNSIYQQLKKMTFSSSPEDTVIITDFSPTKIKALVKTSGNQLITFLQNNYPGWEVFIDNQKAKHFTSNLMSVSAVIPKGEHRLTIVYRNPLFFTGFIISYSSFIILTCLLLFVLLKKHKSTVIRCSATLLPIILAVIITLIPIMRTPYKKIRISEYNTINEVLNDKQKEITTKKTTCIANVDHFHTISNISDQFQQVKTHYPSDLQKLSKIIHQSLKNEQLLYVESNINSKYDAEALIRINYPGKVFSKTTNHSVISLFCKSPANSPEFHLDTTGFDSLTQHWHFTNDYVITDSLTTGNSLYLLDSTHEWGPGFTIKTIETNLGCTFSVAASVQYAFTRFAETLLVIDITDGKEKHHHYTALALPATPSNNKWNNYYASEKVSLDGTEKASINVYIWNRGKANILIDKMKVGLLNPDTK
jgi:hypothetical protein